MYDRVGFCRSKLLNINIMDHKTKATRVEHLSKIPGPTAARAVVNFVEVTPASLASVTLGWLGGILVVTDLLGGIAEGCWVILVTEPVIWGASVADTDGAVTAGGPCPTEMHRIVSWMNKTCKSNLKGLRREQFSLLIRTDGKHRTYKKDCTQ